MVIVIDIQQEYMMLNFIGYIHYSTSDPHVVNDKLILHELIDSIITDYSSTKLSNVHSNLQN
jgi:hypothetical protein